VQAIKKFTEGDAISILDPKLECSSANHIALEQILELALQCVAPRRQNRPIMRRCAEILWNIRKDYREQSASDLRSVSSFSQRSISVREEWENNVRDLRWGQPVWKDLFLNQRQKSGIMWRWKTQQVEYLLKRTNNRVLKMVRGRRVPIISPEVDPKTLAGKSLLVARI
jgi:hypothetical protein